MFLESKQRPMQRKQGNTLTYLRLLRILLNLSIVSFYNKKLRNFFSYSAISKRLFKDFYSLLFLYKILIFCQNLSRICDYKKAFNKIFKYLIKAQVLKKHKVYPCSTRSIMNLKRSIMKHDKYFSVFNPSTNSSAFQKHIIFHKDF